MDGESTNLDCLRSVAVLSVLFAHIWQYFGAVPLNGSIEIHHHFGLYGVILFFVHTSLVLMFSLERQTRQFGWKNWIPLFYLRRAFRIYPLSVVCVVAILLLDLPVGRLNPFQFTAANLDQTQVLANLFLIQNFFKNADILGVLWTLPVEVQMYLFLPFLYLVALKLSRFTWVLGLYLGACAAVSFLDPYLRNWNATFEYFQIPNLWLYIPCFLPGVMSFWLWKNQRRMILPWWTLPLLLAALSVVNLKSYSIEMNFFICATVGLVLPFLKEPEIPWLSKMAHGIAKYSYGIYLLHIICMYVAFDRLSSWPFGLQWIALVVMLVSTSVIAFHWIEMPMIQFGKKISVRLFAKNQY